MKNKFLLILLLAASVTWGQGITKPDYEFTDNFDNSIGASNPFWVEFVSATYNADPDSNMIHGSKVLKFKYTRSFVGEDRYDAWSEARFRLPLRAVALEISFDIYVPPNYIHSPMNHKSLVTWSGKYGKSNANISISSESWGGYNADGATPSVYIGRDGINQSHSWGTTKRNIWYDNFGGWQHMRYYFELATDINDTGLFRIYRNDTLIVSSDDCVDGDYNDPNVQYSSLRGNYIDQGYLMGWQNYAQVDTCTFYIDNLTVKACSTFAGSIAIKNSASAIVYNISDGTIPVRNYKNTFDLFAEIYNGSNVLTKRDTANPYETILFDAHNVKYVKTYTQRR